MYYKSRGREGPHDILQFNFHYTAVLGLQSDSLKKNYLLTFLNLSLGYFLLQVHKTMKVCVDTYRCTSVYTYMAAFIVMWLSPFTIIYKAQGIDVAKTRDHQCKLRGYDTACLGSSDSCEVLKCGRLSPEKHYVFDEIKPRGGVEDGTKCDECKICLLGHCVNPNEGMPTYVGDHIFNECREAQPVKMAPTRHQQCIKHGYKGACVNHDTECEVLYCATQLSKGKYWLQRVLPRWGVDIGTKCGQSKICISGKCVNVVGEMPENIGKNTFLPCTSRKKPLSAPVKTRYEQCKDHGFDAACKVTTYRCNHLLCGYEVFPNFYLAQSQILPLPTTIYPGVASGTKCGISHTCQGTKCVFTPSRSMRNYIDDDIFVDCHKWNYHQQPKRT